jgi:hypothetical protein
MMHAATCYGFFASRRRRALFLLPTAQQVKSARVERAEILRELARGLAALGAVLAWGTLFLLLAG